MDREALASRNRKSVLSVHPPDWSTDEAL